MSEDSKITKGFKGFTKDLKCRDFQFQIGETFEEDAAEICERGFHFCEHPLNCFDYYAPAHSRYCEVSTDCVSPQTHGDTKRVTRKISIGAEISIAGLVKAAVEYVGERATVEDGGHATGDQGAASATGTRGAASATGCQGAASATGCQGAASATGDQGAASATGTRGAASATGTRGAASATGDHSVALAAGLEGRAMGALGCAICCVERDEDDGHIIAVKAAIVDGEAIKANTFYRLENGRFVETE